MHNSNLQNYRIANKPINSMDTWEAVGGWEGESILLRGQLFYSVMTIYLAYVNQKISILNYLSFVLPILGFFHCLAPSINHIAQYTSVLHNYRKNICIYSHLGKLFLRGISFEPHFKLKHGKVETLMSYLYWGTVCPEYWFEHRKIKDINFWHIPTWDAKLSSISLHEKGKKIAQYHLTVLLLGLLPG